uniref:Secreted protein n=1 Tax=Cacopsylla melanoneura TaxID=428564 RepID=A0A8D8TTZ0_9HEMI
MSRLPASVACTFIRALLTVPSDVSCAVTTVAPVDFFLAISGEMSRSVALVALGIHARSAVSFIATSTATSCAGAVSLHVSGLVASIAHGTTHFEWKIKELPDEKLNKTQTRLQSGATAT